MTILRIQKKQQNFVILDKGFLQDTQLSWKAKGLLAYLLSLPDNWRISLKELQRHATNGRDSVHSTIQQLTENRYIVREDKRGKTGQFSGAHYLVFETPQGEERGCDFSMIPSDGQSKDAPCAEKPYPENPDTTNPDPAKPHPENPHLINNNKINIKNNKKSAASKNNNNIAAVDFLKEKIGACFTSQQEQTINQELNQLCLELGIQRSEQLLVSVKQTLLNKQSYTQAQQFFRKKLNTIKKAIRQRTFVVTDPISYSAESKKSNSIQQQMQQLKNEKVSLQNACKLFSDQGQFEYLQAYRNTISKIDEELEMMLAKQQLRLTGTNTVCLPNSSENAQEGF